MTIRAIHLEVAHSLSSDSAIMALKRFMARRGVPLFIYCDNRTNFKGMSEELKIAIKEIDHNKVYEFAFKNKIELRYHAPKEEVLMTVAHLFWRR